MKAGELNGQITIGVFSSSSPVSATVPVRYDWGIEYLTGKTGFLQIRNYSAAGRGI